MDVEIILMPPAVITWPAWQQPGLWPGPSGRRAGPPAGLRILIITSSFRTNNVGHAQCALASPAD